MIQFDVYIANVLAPQRIILIGIVQFDPYFILWYDCNFLTYPLRIEPTEAMPSQNHIFSCTKKYDNINNLRQCDAICGTNNCNYELVRIFNIKSIATANRAFFALFCFVLFCFVLNRRCCIAFWVCRRPCHHLWTAGLRKWKRLLRKIENLHVKPSRCIEYTPSVWATFEPI